MKTKNQQPYFPHDANSRNSDKMIRLRLKHNVAGYGVYYMLMERLRSTETFRSDLDYDVLAYDLQCDKDLIRSVIEDFGLFEIIEDGTMFHSVELSERMEVMLEVKRKRQEAARRAAEARWGKNVIDDSSKMASEDAALPHIAQAIVDKLGDEIKLLKADVEWATAIKKEFNLSELQLMEYIEAFRANCICNGLKDGHTSLVDATKHCRSYIRRCLEGSKKTGTKKGGVSPITEKLSVVETEILKEMDRKREEKKKEMGKPMNSRLVVENYYRNRGYEPKSCLMKNLNDEEWLRNNPPTHPEWIGRFPEDTRLEDVERQLELEGIAYGN